VASHQLAVWASAVWPPTCKSRIAGLRHGRPALGDQRGHFRDHPHRVSARSSPQSSPRRNFVGNPDLGIRNWRWGRSTGLGDRSPGNPHGPKGSTVVSTGGMGCLVLGDSRGPASASCGWFIAEDHPDPVPAGIPVNVPPAKFLAGNKEVMDGNGFSPGSRQRSRRAAGACRLTAVDRCWPAVEALRSLSWFSGQERSSGGPRLVAVGCLDVEDTPVGGDSSLSTGVHRRPCAEESETWRAVYVVMTGVDCAWQAGVG
jgi:hypothetical protein